MTILAQALLALLALIALSALALYTTRRHRFLQKIFLATSDVLLIALLIVIFKEIFF